jgi:hypothetical protein
MTTDIVTIVPNVALAQLPDSTQRVSLAVSLGATSFASGTANPVYSYEDYLTHRLVVAFTPELDAAVKSWFKITGAPALYILEIGTGGTVANVATYLQNGTRPVPYSIICPTAWTTDEGLKSLAQTYDGADDRFYFAINTLPSASFFVGIKSVWTMAKPAGSPATEHPAAALAALIASYNLSPAELMTSIRYSYMPGFTPFQPTKLQKSTLFAQRINWIDTGKEAGLSDVTLLENGVASDGLRLGFWYATNWAQINIERDLAAAVINGSADTDNPLFYDQDGIDRLQQVAQATVNRGISFGLIAGAPKVTAVSFADYKASNPADVAAGIYKGLALTFEPEKGFSAITIYFTVSNIAL